MKNRLRVLRAEREWSQAEVTKTVAQGKGDPEWNAKSTIPH